MFTSVGRALRNLLAAVTSLMLMHSGIAHAQATPSGWSASTPPDVTTLDSFNVDLISGQVQLAEPQLSIGAKGSELTHSYLVYTMLDENAGSIVPQASILDSTPRVSVSLGTSSETFVVSGSTYVNAQGTTSTLVSNTAAGTLTYTKGDGTVAVFNTAWAKGPILAATAVLQALTLPSGEQLTYYYENVGNASVGADWWLQTVVSNRSLMLKYEYGSFGTKVTAINTAIDYCDPSATSCTSLTQAWPTAYLSNAATTFTSSGANSQSTSVYNETNVLGRIRTRTYFTTTQCTGGGTVSDGSAYATGACDSKNSLTLTDEVGHSEAFQYSDIWTGPGAGSTYPSGMVSGVTKGNLVRAYNYTGCCGTQNNWTNSAMVASGGANGSTYNFTFNHLNTNYFSVQPVQKTVLGNNTTYARDGYGRITQVTNPEGDYIQYSYDSRGNFDQATHVSKNGTQSITWRATFPTNCSNIKTCNEPTATFDPNNNETDYTYDPNSGGVATITKPADSNGIRPQTRYTYTPIYAQVMSSAGTLVSQSTPIYLLTNVSTCQSATSANPASCVGTAAETVTTYAYNSSNLFLTAVTEAAGDNSLTATTTTTYDMIGNPVIVDGPRTDVDDRSYKTYDAMRRVVFEIGVDPDGSGPLPRAITHHIYDDAGFEIQTEAGTGNATDGSDFARTSYVTTAYNSAGLKSMVVTYIAGNSTPQTVTQYSYDPSGRMTCSTVRMNPSVFSTIGNTDACTLGTAGTYGPDRITLNSYDTGDELLETDQAYGVTTANGFPQTLQRAYARYTYYPDGEKLNETDANNNTTSFWYDGFNRLFRIYYPSTTTPLASDASDYEQFAYDANSNKVSWQRRNGKTISYSYDALNREITRSVSDGSVQTVYTGYDLQGHTLYARYGSASGAGITNTYDGMGRLAATQDMNGRTLSYTYDQASDRSSLTFPDQQVQYYNYYANGALSGTTSVSNIVGLWLGYDGMGRVAAYGRANNANTGFAYDGIGRLTGLNQIFSSASSAYNIAWTFGYTPANQIASSSASSTIYDYKETASSTVNNTYDGLNRDAGIAAISGGYDADGNLTDDGSRLFYYDVYNRLTGVGTAAYPQNGPFLTLTYDPLGRLASQSYYGTVTSFLHDGTNLVGEYDGNGNMLDRYLFTTGTDQPWVAFSGSALTAANATYLYDDYHGSIIALADSSGNPSAVYKYGPYGEPKNIGNITDFTGFRFRYTGQTVIPEAGLYYYKARVYDPIFGRFLQTDPIGSKDDLDLYAYTKDDPIDHGDPTGLAGCASDMSKQDCDAALAAQAQARTDIAKTQQALTNLVKERNAIADGSQSKLSASAQKTENNLNSWFGNSGSSTIASVQSSLSKIDNVLADNGSKYQFEHSNIGNDLGRAAPVFGTIAHFGDKFFSGNQRDRVVTEIHEVAHIVVPAGDFGYEGAFRWLPTEVHLHNADDVAIFTYNTGESGQ